MSRFFQLILSLMMILLPQIIVSSKDCLANMFYDFVYCVSSTSQCEQCIPCYNDDIHTLYIPTGENNAKQCNDVNNNICMECKSKCQTTFNHKNYDKYITNADPSCPTLLSFVSEMNAQTLSNKNNSIYEYSCENNDKISIQYGIISSTNNEYSLDCSKDIKSELINVCNDQNTCQFDINILFNTLSNCGDTFIAEIGTFCVSIDSTAEIYNGNAFISNSEITELNSDYELLRIILIIIFIIFVVVVILIIFFICIYKTGCNIFNQCQKPILDSQRTLTNSTKSKRHSERAQSDTIDVDGPHSNTNILKDEQYKQPLPNTHTHTQSLPNTTTQHNEYHNPTPPTHTQPQRQYNNNKYNNNYNPTQQYYMNLQNKQQQQDTMVVTLNNLTRQSLSYDNRNTHSYGQHVITTTSDQSHMRNTSVILDGNLNHPTQTRNSPYGGGSFSGIQQQPQGQTHITTTQMSKSNYNNNNGAIDNQYDYGHSLKSHPDSMLNRSDVIFPQFQQPQQPQMNELQHTLVNPINNWETAAAAAAAAAEQKQFQNNNYGNMNVNVDVAYWNNYYGNTSGYSDNNMNNFYVPDFANPNGDFEIDDTKIEVITHVEIQLEAEIGKGCNSKVFKARWRNTEVAAKRFINLDITKKKAREYIDNYAIKINSSPHEHVIKILAIANKPFTLLTEYMNKGSVKNYVRRSRPGSTSISILDRIEIALQAAKGISHLHSLGIIHSEITSSNLLMELLKTTNKNNNKRSYGNRYNINDIRVVITDYAIQQMLSGDELETYRSSLGPLKWMAPELIENSNCKTTKESDIYAFGITMWEIITGQEPYPDVDPVDTAIHVLVKERRPQSYAFIPEKIQNLMKLCWHKNKKERPNANDVVKKLTQFVQLERKQNNERDDLFE